jgi:hypothetical protein
MKKLSFTRSSYNMLLKLFVVSGIIALALPAKACIVYTDESPDAPAWYAITGAINRAVAIDLDGDGNMDLSVTVYRDTTTLSPEVIWAGFAVVDSGNAIAGSFYAGQVSTPYALAAGDTVGKPGQLFQTTYSPNPQSLGVNSAQGTLSYGNWLGQTNKYLGLKFVSNGQIHYGWVRIDFRNSATGDTIIIKDYAYEDIANKPIIAGAMPSEADDARSIVPTDLANNHNGSDMQVTFNKAANESTVSEYRVYVVKDTNSASFNSQNALAVLAGNYTVVSPANTNISLILSSTAKDIDGNAIVEGVAYNVFVLSIADGIIATCNKLSDPSTSITLQPGGIVIADPATAVVATDIANNHNGLDLQVTFSKAANEALVDEYRVVAVKEADAASFTLSLANSLAAANYATVAKTGSNLTTVFTATSKDADGDDIVENETYTVFVLSVADGVTATINALSSPSDTVTLTSITGIENVADAANISVSSLGNQITIKSDINLTNGAEVKIYNTIGQTVYTAVIGQGKEVISLNGANGVYVVSVKVDGKSINRKVVITH